jgi:hypothetical protein
LRYRTISIGVVGVLEAKGPHVPFPYSSGIARSKHDHMRELRVQSGGRPVRIFYAFDPRRSAILLIGGDKTGDKRFYGAAGGGQTGTPNRHVCQ